MAMTLRKPKKKTQPDLLAHYHMELDRSKEWRTSEGYDALWSDMIEAYTGRSIFPSLSHLSSEDRILVNQAFSTINVIYPAVSIAFPKINVNATRPELSDRAMFVDAMLNYQWKHFEMHEPFREAVKDSLLIGHGWGKTLWTYEETDHELTEEEFAERFQTELRDETLLAEAEEREPKPDEDLARNIMTASTVSVEDRPVVERISPFDMYVNPEATSMRDVKWIAQRILRHVDEAKLDEAYSPAARAALAGGMHHRNSGRFGRSEEHLSNELVEIWELYDLTLGTMQVFADGQDGKFLIAPRPMPFTFGHPFSRLSNYEVPDQFYPIGDLEMIVPLVRELSKTRSEMMNHRAKYARKYLVRKSMLQRGDAAKIASKRDGEVIFVEDDTVPLNDIVAPIAQVPMDAGLYNWSQTIEDDITDVSGISEFARGGASTIRRTATEASLLQDAQNARSAEKLDKVEGFLADLAKKLLQINQQFMTGKQVARIVGPEGAALWVPYTREDIKGQYDFEIEAGSTQPRNESFRRQSALSMMEAMAPFIELGLVNAPELLRHVLKDGFDVKNPEKFLTQQQQGGDPNADPSGMNGGMPAGMPGASGADAPQPSQPQRADADVAAALQPSSLGA